MILLAKSEDTKLNIPAKTLREHIDDCLLILELLKKTFPKASEVSTLKERFWEVLRVCIIFHDLGKGHHEFQRLLAGKINNWNDQRHEFFSIPFINALDLFDEEARKLISLVVVGHHKDVENLRTYLRAYEKENSFGLKKFEEKMDFREAFTQYVDKDQILELLHSYNCPLQQINQISVYRLVQSYCKTPYNLDSPDYFALMILFGALKWCDHLGSAQITDIKKIDISDLYFLQRQQNLLRTKGIDFYKHQLLCAQTRGNLILSAPTGSGKTESAFLWLKSQLKNEEDQGRIFYVLPFTASINAMYERLNKAIGQELGKVGMLHGKLREYLNNYFENQEYSVDAKKIKINELQAIYKSIITPIKVTTPFQLLRHLFGLKGYEQGMFEMSGCYLIFDEIHAYSPDVFAQIKVLIEFATQYLKAKVMIMTATMPLFLRRELEASLNDCVQVEATPELYNQFRRHRVILHNCFLHESYSEIKSSLEKGRKVLVVCNTVKSAQYAFHELKGYAGKAILLHSSFSGRDRACIEKKLMGDDINLLVGTQAVEVSLDIDYDIIYTEPAPIDALIQRFGRVNRKREKGICECAVFCKSNEDDKYIYNPCTVDKTLLALNKIVEENAGVIDEALLQEAIDSVYNEWGTKEREEFESSYNYLKVALELLYPMFGNKDTEKEFYEQFDGIKILPQLYIDEFETLLDSGDFIAAESLKVQISKKKFACWLKYQNIRQETYVSQNKDRLFSVKYYLTNKEYNLEEGLLSDKESAWKVSNFL